MISGWIEAGQIGPFAQARQLYAQSMSKKSYAELFPLEFKQQFGLAEFAKAMFEADGGE